MADTRSCKLHAIIFPLPYQGHINPFVNLAIKLASKGLTITFVHTQHVHYALTKSNKDKLETDLFSEARKSGLDIRYSTISDGFPVEFDRLLHLDEYSISLLNDFPGRVDEFIRNVIGSGSPPVSVLIADSFFAWPPWIAKKYDLVNVSFFTQPALVFNVGCHWDLVTQNGHFPVKGDTEEEIKYIPGVDSISTKDLMSYFKEEEIETVVHKAVFAAFHEMNKADFVLHYTVQELESKTLNTLSKNQPTYAIGPVYSFTNRPETMRPVAKSLRSESDCTKWLDSKPPGSVLYISFGSVVQTSKQVIQEIAYGLLLSGVNFLWVVREDILKSGDSDIFPDGFQDEIKDRGLIVPWCDQVMVLSNPGVGGFVTHCGWNSTLESMWCGVPMICNPMAYDQFTNRKLVVEDLMIGINLSDGGSIHREEVAEKIIGFMSGSASQGLRQQAEKVKKTLHDALDIGGSSERNFDKFIEDLTTKIINL